MASTTSTAIIQLRQRSEQEIGCIRRIIGLMRGKYLVDLIDCLDLEANPRNSKLGPITAAIQDSIRADEANPGNPLFPIKSKGLLLAASGCNSSFDRNRIRLVFEDRETEGILDGGHNTLAAGAYILAEAERALGKKAPRASDMNIWEKFKSRWCELRDDVDEYLCMIREDPSSLREREIGLLKFEVPVELLVPLRQDDELCVEAFRSSLLEICAARNNNAQLSQSTKGDKAGLYDSFRALFRESDPEFEQDISWKDNDGGRVRSRDLVALAWIPLSLTKWTAPSSDDKVVDAPKPTLIYAGKEKCLSKYLDLMQDPAISNDTGSSKKELKDIQVESALKVAVDLPDLFDVLYELFPQHYEGHYGNIGAVKGMSKKKGGYTTPFFQRRVDKPVPDGFLYPLVFGLRALMEYRPDENRIEWATDPFEFVRSDAYVKVIEEYSGVIQQSDYDPQKVGKGAMSYTAAENATKLAYLSSK